MELKIKADNKTCMRYVLSNLEDLQAMARLKGVYKVVGALSGLVTEVRVKKDSVEINCGKVHDRYK